MPIEERKIAQIDTRSEYFQDIFDKVPNRVTVWGSTGMLIIFVVLCLGLKLIRYPEVVNSEAKITTDTPPIEGYSRTSGRISYLLKGDQEKVNAGEWIVILRNSADYQDVLRLIDLLKTVDPNDLPNSTGRQTFIPLRLGDMQESYAQFVKAAGEMTLFLSLHSYSKQMNINAARQKDLDSLKRELDAHLAILEKQNALAKSDYERNVDLAKDTIISRSELEQKEIAYLAQKTKAEELKNTMINSVIQAEMVKKENATLKTDNNNSFFSLTNDLMQAYDNLVFELSSWENKYVIDAPISGVLNLYDIRHKDQYLSNEMKVFTITPLASQHYFALIKLPVANSGRVRVGQKCNIKLHNYPYEEYGMIRGTVESISAAAQEGFYSVKVKLPDGLRTTLNKTLYTRSELLGTGDIIIKDYDLFQRLFNYLITKSN